MITLKKWLAILTILFLVGVAISVFASIRIPRFIPLFLIGLYSFPIALLRIMYNDIFVDKPGDVKRTPLDHKAQYDITFGEDLWHLYLDTARRLVLPVMILTVIITILWANGIIGPL